MALNYHRRTVVVVFQSNERALVCWVKLCHTLGHENAGAARLQPGFYTQSIGGPKGCTSFELKQGL